MTRPKATTYPVVVRRDNHPMINATRISLFDVMDHLKWGCSADEILDSLPLTKEQVDGALQFINSTPGIEDEYQANLQWLEDRYQQWRRENADYIEQCQNSPFNSDPRVIALRARKKELDESLGLR